MIITNAGIIIRISVDNIGVYSRNTQGVRLIHVGDDESVSKVAIVEAEAEEEEVETSENVVENNETSVSEQEVIDNENKE